VTYRTYKKKVKLIIAGKKFEVNNKKYLLNILNPTSKNTKYFDPPPKGKITNLQIGRILLQVHQIIFLVNNLGFSFKNKTFLDVGCGNGMIPRLISSLTKIKYSYGIDPYLDGEHKTSWPKLDHYKVFLKIIKLIKNKKFIDYKNYSKFLKYENFSLRPEKQKIIYKKNYKYDFKKLSGLEITKLKKKFDIIYFKSIEHFNNWDLLFRNLKNSTNRKGILIFKHRSFFSYLGAHRYASIGIPWGHLLLSETEYERYIKKFHKNRYSNMKEFYYKGLKYPRSSVSDLMKFASKYSFRLKFISIEPPHYNKKTTKYLNDVNNIWESINKNFPKVPSEEILSGIYHIVLEKL